MSERKISGKIIVVGAQRTGTTSLGEALLELGYSVLGTPAKDEVAQSLLEGDNTIALAEAAKYDALQDLPWVFLYQDLDKAFPGSKFILLKRKEESWIKSMLTHFGHTDTQMRKWAYGAGTPLGNESMYLERFRLHYQEIQDYFKDRPEDLLEMSLSAGDGWEKLCTFLGQAVPTKPFPRANKSKSNYSLYEKIYAGIRSLVPKKGRRLIMQVLGMKDRRNRFNNAPTNEPGAKSK